MAKTSLVVDRPKLEQSISIAEKTGPLKNLGELNQRVTSIYNSLTPPALITPSVVGLRIREWSLPILTKSGKSKRFANAKAKSGIEVVIHLTDWETRTVEKGPSVGNEVTTRKVIALDKYNWILTSVDKDGNLTSDRKYYPGFRILLSDFMGVTGINPLDCVFVIVARLNELLGMKVVVNMSREVKEIGHEIDVKFAVNHCVRDDVYKRLFRQEAAEVEAEE